MSEAILDFKKTMRQTRIKVGGREYILLTTYQANGTSRHDWFVEVEGRGGNLELRGTSPPNVQDILGALARAINNEH